MKAPKRFHKAFVTLPSAWRNLTYLQRSIIQDVWRMSDEEHLGIFETDGDPVEFIVRALDLAHRNERAPAIRATKILFERGLLAKCESGVQVHLACTQGASEVHAGCTPGAFISDDKPAESLKTGPVDQIRIDQKRETENLARAREATADPHAVDDSPAPQPPQRIGIPAGGMAALAQKAAANQAGAELVSLEAKRQADRRANEARFQKPPVPQPRTDFDPPPETLQQYVVREHFRIFKEITQLNSCTENNRFTKAEPLARWCDSEANNYGCDPKELANRCLAAFFDDEKARAAGYQISWLANSPVQYVGLPAKAKTIAKANPADRQMPYHGRILASAVAGGGS